VRTVKGYHGEWNMGSPGGWEYQRIAQLLGKMAWDLILENTEVGVDIEFDHPQINAVPGFARMILRAHENSHGRNPVHAVLLAETETLDVVLENKNFVDYLNTLDGVKASLAGPGHLSLKSGKVYCKGDEATVIFMDFNMNKLIKIAQNEDIKPIKEAIRQGILVNPRGMEPLGAKGLFEVITERYRDQVSEDTLKHTPWTRQFYSRSTSGPEGKSIGDLVAWIEERWDDVILKPAHGYSGHGIFQIQNEVNRKAIEMGFTYLLGPIMIALRPRLLTVDHIADLRQYAHNLWFDAVKLEELWCTGQLDDVVRVAEEEKELALDQPWRGSPALMVSDGLFSFGADLMNEE